VIFTIDATTTPPTFNQDDGQVVKGLTLGATGAVTQRINVLANWAWFNTRLETQNAANNGNRLTLTPARSGSFWATVALPRRFTAGGGVRYMSTVFVNAANTIRTPGSTIADAVIDYAVDQRLTLRFNINNLTNASYIRSVNNNGNRFNPGFPRSFMITTSVKL
jgi:catecholate siderophore receptor